MELMKQGALDAKKNYDYATMKKMQELQEGGSTQLTFKNEKFDPQSSATSQAEFTKKLSLEKEAPLETTGVPTDELTAQFDQL